jgi:hypothetical protein
MSHYIHNVPGRLRIKSPALKGKDAKADLMMALSHLQGLGTMDLNPKTGSLLVYYNPSLVEVSDIISVVKRRGYFDPDKAVTNDQYIHNAASKAGQVVGKAFLGSALDIALKGSPLSFLTLFI